MPTTDWESPYLTATEAAAYLRISLRTLYRYIADGTLTPSGRTNRGWLFDIDALDKWAESNLYKRV